MNLIAKHSLNDPKMRNYSFSCSFITNMWAN